MLPTTVRRATSFVGADIIVVDAESDILLDDGYHGSKLLTRCLLAWRQSEADIGLLSTMSPSCGYLLLQVLDIVFLDDKPTGVIVVHDGEYYVTATVDRRYLVELQKRRWGLFSILQVKGTSGLHHELVIVSIFFS